jgi:hypothetical protein
MSATSSKGRIDGSAVGALGFYLQLEMLERACHRPDRLRGDTGIERGRVELGMPEQSRAIVRILLCY